MLSSCVLRWSLFFSVYGLLILSSCQPERPKLSMGAEIRQSFVYERDSLFLPASNEVEGLIVDGTDLDLDFGGAYLVGANFGASPDLQTGTALKVKKATKLRIRNANFLGFQIGIHVQKVDTLILENCHFDYFQRSGTTENSKPISIGLWIENAPYVILQNCTWQRMDQSIRIQEATRINIQQCSFLWINHQAIQMEQNLTLECTSSLFAYIGLPSNNAPVFRHTNTKLQLDGNHWAHCRFNYEDLTNLNFENNSAAYVDFVTEEQWKRPAVDQLLLQKGISTPSLSLVDQWGWYDFAYPKAWFRQGTINTDVYLLTAPPGNWRVIDGNGYSRVIPKTGAFPSTVQAQFSSEQGGKYLEFEFLGKPLKRFGKPFYSKEVFTFKAQEDETKK